MKSVFLETLFILLSTLYAGIENLEKRYLKSCLRRSRKSKNKEVQPMKTIVIYNSQTGFTKRYAEWIAEAAGADCLELSAAKKKGIRKPRPSR